MIPMHEVIIEPVRVERLYWRDLWRYRELLLLPVLARHPGSVQADGGWCCLVGNPAVFNHGHLDRGIRKIG